MNANISTHKNALIHTQFWPHHFLSLFGTFTHLTIQSSLVDGVTFTFQISNSCYAISFCIHPRVDITRPSQYALSLSNDIFLTSECLKVVQVVLVKILSRVASCVLYYQHVQSPPSADPFTSINQISLSEMLESDQSQQQQILMCVIFCHSSFFLSRY